MRIERLMLGLLHTNCYILYDEKTKEAVVVDPATSFEKIEAKLNELNLQVKYIILTHAHSDHICALDKLADITGAKVCIGSDDAAALNNGEINLCNYFRHPSPTRVADILLNDGDRLTLSGTTLKIISTPGHTCGSISIFFENSVISGDTLFFESVGRTDFVTSSTTALMKSIKDKLYLLDRSCTVYPGHGEFTTIGHEIDNNPFVW